MTMASEPRPIGAYMSAELMPPPVSSGTAGGSWISTVSSGTGGF